MSLTSATCDSGKVDGTGSIERQQWDIGTGVTGFAWHAVDPVGVILLQHGWGDYTERWVDGAGGFIPAAVDRGFTVYGFDMWGSGRSPGLRGVTDIRAAVDDHAAARSKIRDSSAGVLPLFLVGHSIGGLVAATSVLDDQRGVAGVVLLAPGLLYDVPSVVLAVARIAAFVAPSAYVPGMTNDDGVAALTSDSDSIRIMGQDPNLFLGPMNFLTASTGGSLARENWARYQEWNVPVLAVHGTADDGTEPRGSADFIAAVACTDASLRMVENAKHAILDDTMADTVLTDVLSWLDERTGHAHHEDRP